MLGEHPPLSTFTLEHPLLFGPISALFVNPRSRAARNPRHPFSLVALSGRSGPSPRGSSVPPFALPATFLAKNGQPQRSAPAKKAALRAWRKSTNLRPFAAALKDLNRRTSFFSPLSHPFFFELFCDVRDSYLSFPSGFSSAGNMPPQNKTPKNLQLYIIPPFYFLKRS